MGRFFSPRPVRRRVTFWRPCRPPNGACDRALSWHELFLQGSGRQFHVRSVRHPTRCIFVSVSFVFEQAVVLVDFLDSHSFRRTECRVPHVRNACFHCRPWPPLSRVFLVSKSGPSVSLVQERWAMWLYVFHCHEAVWQIVQLCPPRSVDSMAMMRVYFIWACP